MIKKYFKYLFIRLNANIFFSLKIKIKIKVTRQITPETIKVERVVSPKIHFKASAQSISGIDRAKSLAKSSIKDAILSSLPILESIKL